MSGGSLLIFDFDHSLIDCNSDPWVVDQLGASELMLSIRPHIGSWTDLMDRIMVEIAARGRNIGDVEDALKRVPLHPAMNRAIKTAHSWGWELQIISDANIFFIETILSLYDLKHHFTEIHTNPAHVDEQGVLRIQPYQKPPAHQCGLCPSNMCKGLILDDVRATTQLRKCQTIYIGDGSGDYCPCLRLQEGDHILAREGYPLLRLLQRNNQAIRAQVHVWSSALDVESYLLQLHESEQRTPSISY